MHVYAYVYHEPKSTCQGLDAPALILHIAAIEWINMIYTAIRDPRIPDF